MFFRKGIKYFRLVMSRKKVSIIPYYWLPRGGSGVQRWLKFVKYLADFGGEPIVFTLANSRFFLKDVNALTSVIKLPIWEPCSLFQKLPYFTQNSKFGTGKTYVDRYKLD